MKRTYSELTLETQNRSIKDHSNGWIVEHRRHIGKTERGEDDPQAIQGHPTQFDRTQVEETRSAPLVESVSNMSVEVQNSAGTDESLCREVFHAET